MKETVYLSMHTKMRLKNRRRSCAIVPPICRIVPRSWRIVASSRQRRRGVVPCCRSSLVPLTGTRSRYAVYAVMVNVSVPPCMSAL